MIVWRPHPFHNSSFLSSIAFLPGSKRTIHNMMIQHLGGFTYTLAIAEHTSMVMVGGQQKKPEVKDQAYYIELAIAMKKLEEAELKAK